MIINKDMTYLKILITMLIVLLFYFTDESRIPLTF